MPYVPQPPNCQRPTAVKTNTENATLKNENAMTKKLLATQELQMKRLKTVIDDLQTQLEKVKFENRTLKQVGPPLIAVVFKIHFSSSKFVFLCLFIYVQPVRL